MTDELEDYVEPYHPAQIHWFGEPWPSAERRAPVCEDDRYRVDVPVGKHCLECGEAIRENERGVLLACSPGLWGSWRVGGVFRVADHLRCFLRSVVGGEMSRELWLQLNRKVDDDWAVPSPVTDDADVEPGRGWKKGGGD